MITLKAIVFALLVLLVEFNVASPNVSRRSALTCVSSNIPRFNPLAVFRDPPASGSPSAALGMINVATIPGLSWGIFSAGGGTGGWLFYNLQNGAIFPIGSAPFPAPVSVALVSGESPLFVSIRNPPTPFAGYCSAINPAGGPDILSVGGQSLWSLCPNTTAGGRSDLVWSPIANHAHYSLPSCQEVDIQMIPA
ncbi:hypothetical protein CCMSSC00406_0009476 [Pleurotus cornucopiae]|uniref:Uncharacterized protein n=1 Tax=Pleurotus cornucopiae TaxID=5321 RepID=A0ACB7J335_PLECO|nr:hypothetical protein CCMSSC00406_0009476 [Pleurotus cornucopiae]